MNWDISSNLEKAVSWILKCGLNSLKMSTSIRAFIIQAMHCPKKLNFTSKSIGIQHGYSSHGILKLPQNVRRLRIDFYRGTTISLQLAEMKLSCLDMFHANLIDIILARKSESKLVYFLQEQWCRCDKYIFSGYANRSFKRIDRNENTNDVIFSQGYESSFPTTKLCSFLK